VNGLVRLEVGAAGGSHPPLVEPGHLLGDGDIAGGEDGAGLPDHGRHEVTHRWNAGRTGWGKAAAGVNGWPRVGEQQPNDGAGAAGDASISGSRRIVAGMDAGVTAVIAGCLGLLTGAIAVAAFRWSDRIQRREQPDPAGSDPAIVSEQVVRVLSVLPGAAFVAGPDGRVLRASSQAVILGVVSGDRVRVPEVVALVDQVHRDGVIRELDLDLARPMPATGQLQLRVRAAPLSSRTTLVLVEDVSEALRVDAIRRDFVANVSHELKTPVGALSLLAEAVGAASDEPAAVRRFAQRMEGEAHRLTNLVNDLIDLSRLQGADEPHHPRLVPVAHLVAEALDGSRMMAQARQIEVVSGDLPDRAVSGDESQLVMALRNLVTNAVAYSPEHTRVVVSTRIAVEGFGEFVEIAVTDQGIGIPPTEQERIFERFYRVDPARSRLTGGTGLGLAIVKHVCATHGGQCLVWSMPGEGSTFTLRLPLLGAPTRALRASEPVTEATGASDRGVLR
jgi:two-component system sensor histidine kinase SenX3